MVASHLTRTCKDCKTQFAIAEATNSDGQIVPRGFYCRSCGQRRASNFSERIARRDGNIRRNLWEAYRGWWKHYTPPKTWQALLRSERKFCPYCGVTYSDDHSPRNERTAVIDHMDPLSRGGEDSMRNAVFCCYLCNGRKHYKLFVNWLDELSEQFRSKSREIYVFKHEHLPEAFQAGSYEFRGEGVPIFLEYDEEEFKRELEGMLPLQTQPPASFLCELLKPHPGPVDLEALIFRDSPPRNNDGR
jgi:hypothetical protein